MKSYMSKAVRAVYIPMSLALIAFIELAILASFAVRYTQENAKRASMLELYASAKIDSLSLTAFDPLALASHTHVLAGPVFSRLAPSGRMYFVDKSSGTASAYEYGKSSCLRLDDPSPVLGFEPVTRALDGESGVYRGRDLEGSRVIGVYRPVPGRRAAVFVSIQAAEVMKPLAQEYAITAPSMVVAVSLFLLAAVARGRRFRLRSTDTERMVLAAEVFGSIVEGITITDADGIIKSVNRAFTEITGWSSEEAVGQNPRILKSDRHDAKFYAEMWTSISQLGSWSGEIWNRKKDGTVYPERLTISAVRETDGSVSSYVAVFLDLSELKDRDAAISRLSARDPLTGLPNRALYVDRLVTAVKQAEREGERLALLYIDIARFKYINTSYGYGVGDAALQAVADRLERTLRRGDTVARVSADDFLALLPRLKKEDDARVVAESVMKALREPLTASGKELFLDASIGISFYPDAGSDPDALIGAANSALNQAKESGPGSVKVFTTALSDRMSMRLSLESKLRRAVEKESFAVHYQARIDARTRRVEGMEALVRWVDDDGTLISPGAFIPLAEENGLIIPIGEWVLAKALSDLVAFHAIDPGLSVSVNLSARQFRLPDLGRRVDDALSKSGISADRLELEITESLAMGDVSRSVAVLTTLNERGISFSLDDFGTGYSSLYYLKRLPIQWLKIDRSFVRDIKSPDDSPANAIVKTILEMSASLGLGTIAEGCETEEQFGYLSRRGCSQIQGFLFSKPVPASEFAKLAGATL